MPRHMLSATTRTLELKQLREINDRLPGRVQQMSLRAQDLGVTGVRVHVRAASTRWRRTGRTFTAPRRAAGQRRPAAFGRSAAPPRGRGLPSFPYIWGLFGRGRTRGTTGTRR